MKTVIKSLAIGAALFAAPLTAVADGHSDNLKYVLVSHAPDSDSWWNTIKNGIALAGDQMGVEVEYRNPPTGDLGDMARIIEQAAASGPNGIITTLADYDVLKGPIMDAVASGIDVIIMNCADLYAVPQVGTPMLPDDPHQAPSRPTGRCRSQLSGSSRPGYTWRSGGNLHCTAPLLDK